MPAPKISDADFIRLFEAEGATALANRLGIYDRAVFSRARRLQARLGRELINPRRHDNHTSPMRPKPDHFPGRIETELQDGIVLVASDCHYWPGDPSLMHRAFVSFCKEMQPQVVIANGDVLDFGGISRHPPLGWQKLPTVQEEIEAAQDRLHEISMAAGKNCRRYWPAGNHDARFSTRIAQVAPEYALVKGTRLVDHFPEWEPCWSVFINDDVVVKHRFKGGVHATHNSALWAGRTMVTGHLHSAKVTPLTDYNGTRWGVDTGCLADPNSRAFEWMEDNPRNWRTGFACLTFKDGRLLFPEIVTQWDDNSVQFRGSIIKA